MFQLLLRRLGPVWLGATPMRLRHTANPA